MLKAKNVAVYKTNVIEPKAAKSILDLIRKKFQHYDVSIDLDDCDNVLRVENLNGSVDDTTVKKIVSARGHQIERLPVN